MKTEHAFTPWVGKQEADLIRQEAKNPIHLRAARFMSQARKVDPKDKLVAHVRGLVAKRGGKDRVTELDCIELSGSPHVARIFGYKEPAAVYALVQLVDSLH